MNQQIKQQWVEALRSGTYAQAQYGLRFPEGYCVGGVLCDLHSIATATPWEERPRDLHPYRYQDHRTTTPPAVLTWAGLSRDQENVLAVSNDKGLSFETLADWIDANL